MRIEYFILIAISIGSAASLIYIPKNEFRRALVAFLLMQASSWLIALVLVESKSIVFPVREFPKATRSDFVPQFLFYPATYVWFILLYPKDKGLFMKALHYIIFLSIPVWYIYFTSTYTNLRKPLSGNLAAYFFVNYTTFFLQYRIFQLIIRWFFKENHLLKSGD